MEHFLQLAICKLQQKVSKPNNMILINLIKHLLIICNFKIKMWNNSNI